MFQKVKKFSTLLFPSIRTYVIAAILVLIAFLGITFWSWNNANTNLDKDIQTSLDNATMSAGDLINNSVTTYSEVLRSSAGLFNAIPSADEDAWKHFVQYLDIKNKYTGMQALAFSQYVPSGQLGSFLETYKQPNGMPYEIIPSSPRNEYVVTRFIEPATNENLTAIGFDPSTEPIRRKAMEKARDSGQTVATERTILIQDNEESSFIMFTPVYKRDTSVNNVEERRNALLGYVSAGVRYKDLIDGLFDQVLTQDSAIKVYDGAKKNSSNLVYQSPSFNNLVKQEHVTTTSKVLDIYGVQWTLDTYVNQQFTTNAQRKLPQTILITGISLSFLISALLLIIMISRARSITNEKNKEVQEVKDSLISLASHQLRTPATGVKQFVGMVLEGYAGNLSSEQREMLGKAYDSNERQLEIINQILHVTRADSGRLVLNYEKVNVNEVIKTVIDELKQSTIIRQQKISFKPSSKNIYINADKQFLAMVVDNLLSNASKYSHIKKRIVISLQRTRDGIVILVTDKGVGIHQKDLHLLFQKFSRIHNELSVEAGGNGIGLYLCKEIIEMHSGTILVNSEPHKGSQFIITLPRTNPNSHK